MARDVMQEARETTTQYEETRRHWREFVEITADQVGQAGEWQPWLPRTYWNGMPMSPDVDPLCDARSAKLGRAVRVIRLSASEGMKLRAWLTKFDYTASGGPGPTDELVICLTLWEKNAALARILLRRWMDERVSLDEMRELIREMLYPVPEDFR